MGPEDPAGIGLASRTMSVRPAARLDRRALAARRRKSASSWDACWRNSRSAARESPVISSVSGSGRGRPTHEAVGIKAIPGVDPG